MRPRRAWEARRARVDRVTGRDSVVFARRRIESATVAVEEECLLMSRIDRDLTLLEEQVVALAEVVGDPDRVLREDLHVDLTHPEQD